MRPFSMVFVLLALLTSCTPAGDSDGNAKSVSPSGQARVSALRNASGVHAGPGAGIASLPDRGSLMAYDRVRRIASNRAYTWYPVTLSEAHALNAIRTGRLALTAPDGSVVSLSYDRHDEHPDGSWSWIGHDRDSGDALLTFGPEAVFGSVTRTDGSLLRITTRSNQVYVVSVDPEQLANSENSGRFRKADFLVPPRTAAAITDRRAIAAARPGAADAGVAVDAVAAAANEIDLLLGYSNGLVASIGSESGAVTRMQNLVAITNQAYENSSITMRIRLVRSMLVNYPDNTANESALEKLTGRTGSGSTPVDPAFNALRAAREESGADLVSLVRQFRTPENDGCGIAWLLGGGQTAIDQSDEAFGYSVVSDGSDADGASTYFCRDETLAHELGHNMGQAHNIEDSDGSSGAHAYSYGYREASASGFYTVMAYRLSDSSQTGIRHFANPAVTWNGRPTGTASQADNARSMNQTMPILSNFRTQSTPAPTPSSINLYAISKLGGSNRTEVHSLSRVSSFTSFDRNISSILHQTGTDNSWQFQFGDYNRDGITDIYAISKLGGLGRTEVHVLNGATGFSTFLLHAATILHSTGADSTWIFRTGDFNRDGILDLYAIGRKGGSGRTEVHVLNGATGFTSYITNLATALSATGSDYSWNFALGDMNRDGYPDLFAISKLGPGSNTTELHVLDGASAFQRFLIQTPTALHATGTDNSWVFKVADFNGDGSLDLYAINKVGASERTEVHVLDGAAGFLRFSAHIATALHATGTGNDWDFDLGLSR